ncbi:hypothetical protein KHA94_13515 [Bacillus sp. FJAT-49705]|uniref:Uncharacterized protein n=1 Tax=Cytobacillus citreus TaxID=2833586 RepID=A0ABS5NTN6_9BACI|nr:hypothetical protein [Cytobacillus citreus]MBS4191202.1 hypothetical protein [Cytobacillus citreus]
MNKTRIAILLAIYEFTRSLDNMDAEFLISDINGKVNNLFDYQRMERKGYIELLEIYPTPFESSKCYAVLTVDGVDYIEKYLEFTDKEEMEIQALNLRLDRMERVASL